MFGGPIARSAHCVVSVGADEPERDLAREYRWASDYSIEFQWVDRELFQKHSYHGTGYHRYLVKSNADIVALFDADIIVSGNLDRIILHSYLQQELLGFIAHASPFRNSTDVSSEEYWERIFDFAGLPKPSLAWRHSGLGLIEKIPNDPQHQYCPAYFNNGVIFSPRQFVERMADVFIGNVQRVESILDTAFKSQIANTLSLYQLKIPFGILPVNYNFPLNLPERGLREMNPDPNGENEIEDIKIYHYLASGEVNKRHFETEESLAELLSRENMSPAAKAFQTKLRILQERMGITRGSP